MIAKIKELVYNAAVYIPFNCEGIRIETYDDVIVIDRTGIIDPVPVVHSVVVVCIKVCIVICKAGHHP